MTHDRRSAWRKTRPERVTITNADRVEETRATSRFEPEASGRRIRKGMQTSQPAGRQRGALIAGRALAAAVFVCLSIGCATGEEGTDARERSAALAGRSPLTRNILNAGESGLRIVHWRVDDRTTPIARALATHAEPSWPDSQTGARLERNGFRLSRVELAAIEALPDELGGVSLDLDGWFGQILEWRELTGRDVEADGRAVALAGRVQRFNGGRMRLMIRGWTMAMERGPQVYLEMVPEYQRAGMTRLDQVLGRRGFKGERYPDLGTDLMLDAGYAYVLTCETPGVAWGTPAPDAPPSAPARAVGPGGVGPSIDAPEVLGELLLRTPGQTPQRDLFVFIPKIPAELLPDTLPRMATQSAHERQARNGRDGP